MNIIDDLVDIFCWYCMFSGGSNEADESVRDLLFSVITLAVLLVEASVVHKKQASICNERYYIIVLVLIFLYVCILQKQK